MKGIFLCWPYTGILRSSLLGCIFLKLLALLGFFGRMVIAMNCTALAAPVFLGNKSFLRHSVFSTPLLSMNDFVSLPRSPCEVYWDVFLKLLSLLGLLIACL